MKETFYKVYVKVDENNCITDINSEIFISDLTGWIYIDEGIGDKYAHAQGNYLDKPLAGIGERFNYRLVDGKVIEEGGEIIE